MKKNIISILLVFLVITANAQKMEDVFVKMPDDIIIQLEEAWRKDLVGLYKSGKPAILENTMQGKSTLQKLTDDYLLLQSTEHSSVELKLLPLVNNTYIICMVETVYAPVADSRVSFYTTEWQPLQADGLYTPVTENMFVKGEDELSPSELIIALAPGSSIFLVKYNLGVENATLTAEYTSPQYLDEESRNKMESMLKTEAIVYKWNAGRFEQKQSF